MAHLWILDDHDWAASPLVSDVLPLGDGAFLRRLAGSPNSWTLLTDHDQRVRVNGMPAPLGLAVLADRDEVRLPGFVAWFSTETLAHVEPFPDTDSRGFCPRCKQAITTAAPAVRCPGCRLWHHASEDLPCWTYAPTCAGCAQETALDAGFRWTPEDL